MICAFIRYLILLFIMNIFTRSCSFMQQFPANLLVTSNQSQEHRQRKHLRLWGVNIAVHKAFQFRMKEYIRISILQSSILRTDKQPTITKRVLPHCRNMNNSKSIRDHSNIPRILLEISNSAMPNLMNASTIAVFSYSPSCCWLLSYRRKVARES